MGKFVTMGVDGTEPETYGPDEGSVIAGAPRFRSWTLDEAEGGLSSGLWEATQGKWNFENAHWEYCRILSGVSVVTEEGGAAHLVRAGDSFVLRAGFRGTWEVIETTRKDYVIRT
ncbi:cupin [Bosea sp. Tri-44]|uniref:cupin domain-containing protein n=1 Tax=Bosea sp. Tri-44 TaxID=1972137 RepID=UPI00100E9DED|nr:cupin domain-containing protein [Bosea sp. Tri-44]RXT51255.1 cupin [Bosea sp. Tri-44]